LLHRTVANPKLPNEQTVHGLVATAESDYRIHVTRLPHICFQVQFSVVLLPAISVCDVQHMHFVSATQLRFSQPPHANFVPTRSEKVCFVPFFVDCFDERFFDILIAATKGIYGVKSGLWDGEDPRIRPRNMLPSCCCYHFLFSMRPFGFPLGRGLSLFPYPPRSDFSRAAFT